MRTEGPESSGKQRWLRERYARAPERDALFTTISGEPIEPLYGPEDLPPFEEIGYPGEFPYTRGVYPSMYRGRLWTMRQFAGFGTAEETNARFLYLLEHGQTGLSTAFDMPSLMGHDSDHPRAEGEVGREGVAIDSVVDMERLFRGIPLDRVSVSMTINAPAAVMLAFFVVAAERQGVPADKLRGTIQTDILKEYIAQKEWCFPIDPAMRLVTDMIEFCAREMPLWHPISVSGYHIREAGATAQQELAFTLKDGFTYVEHALERGLDIDAFAPSFSFFFNSHIDFFEEIAKFRAARRIWARELRDTYGAKDERSLLMRFHTQTAGCSLTAQQPLNNIVRTAIEALAAVLGGTQSLHTNSYDEALALPTEEAARVALRTQQIIAHETGVTNTIDPLGGSYFVEALTSKMESAAYNYFRRIDELGGMVEAIKQNFPQREIAEASFRYQQEVERGERVIVGVNRYRLEDGAEEEVEILRIPPEVERKQIERVRRVRAERDEERAQRALERLREAAREEDRNLMWPLLDCARAHCTEGEIVESLQRVFGRYVETPVF
ncbi:acyl-CoA mutase large subunit family protein [Thermoleophilum album]|uniref:Methylmalonyl-CoA mutase, N-terminal domain n=1 Tax=Thermoleophilum album TaxID=29539 RepID=A0A1H6FKI0_THEAL|nr:methylmalonyl-CoA mutase family protein [Thermoleophilum album]SEH10343.1 methylmalonyl-CoA mutase, N-terminal domain [Thermoleophilum album]